MSQKEQEMALLIVKRDTDMCHGPLFIKLIRFSLPIILCNLLQILYNAADMIVIGQFGHTGALAAVGATSSLINLIVNLFTGLSVGAGVVVAQYFGAENDDGVHRAVHTSLLTAGICGLVMMGIGLVVSRWALIGMGCPTEKSVLPQATTYMRFYFLGVPGSLIANFGSSILRSVGDSKRPLYFFSLSGVVNIGLNLLFVIAFDWNVMGVALATAISQYLAMALILLSLSKAGGSYRFSWRKLRIHGEELKRIVQIGLPAGVQSSLFSISNVLIQSSVNSFGAIAMEGNAAAGSLEAFTYTAMDSITQTALTFTGQNVGARTYERLHRICVYCNLLAVAIGLIMGIGTWALSDPLLHIYSHDPAAIGYGQVRLLWLCAPYCLCGFMNILNGCLRGMGESVRPMLITIGGVCVLRIVWIYTIFAWHHDFWLLIASYPLSWIVTALVLLVCYFRVHAKVTAS